MTNYCFIYHHDDPDGSGAAAGVNRLIESSGLDGFLNDGGRSSYVMIGSHETDYNDYEFNAHTKCDYICSTIFVVDLSFSRHTIDSLLKLVNSRKMVIWIDHHQSSVDIATEMKDQLDSYKNLFYMVSNDLSATALVEVFSAAIHGNLDRMYSIECDDYEVRQQLKGVHQFYYDTIENGRYVVSRLFGRDYNISRFAYYIDQYDRWTKQDPDADYFVQGLRLHGYKFDNGNNLIYHGLDDCISVYNDADIDSMINDGKLAAKAINMLMEDQLDRVNKVNFVDGTIYMKMCCGNSLNFCHLSDAPETAFVMVVGWDLRLNKFSCSIYRNNKNADVLTITAKEIADLFGGGGHDGAAGFKTSLNMMDMLPKYAYGRTMREAFKVLSLIETGERHE